MPPLDGLFQAINQLAIDTPWLHGPTRLYAKDGILLFGLLIVVGWWLARSRGPQVMAAALLTPVATVVAFAVQQLVVMVVDEARPYAVHPGALVLIDRTTDPSFPSDHACVVGAVAGGLFFVDRRLGWVASALALLMAGARVYVGVHWPLDVVAGLLLGGAVAGAVLLALGGPVGRLVERLRTTALRPLLATAAIDDGEPAVRLAG